jgi:hypothetical protein
MVRFDPTPNPLTRVGFLHCREGKTWGTRKDSGQGRKAVQNHILLVTKTPLCRKNLPCLLSLLVFGSPALTDNIKNLPL